MVDSLRSGLRTTLVLSIPNNALRSKLLPAPTTPTNAMWYFFADKASSCALDCLISESHDDTS